jgi:hypothetical protein
MLQKLLPLLLQGVLQEMLLLLQLVEFLQYLKLLQKLLLTNLRLLLRCLRGDLRHPPEPFPEQHQYPETRLPHQVLLLLRVEQNQ